MSPLFQSRGNAAEVETTLVFQPKFDSDGLIPAIVTDAAAPGQVLMFAWMTAEALKLTIDTGVAHFWTRSRKKIWKKGEDSGNLLIVKELRTDCDQDVLWLRVVTQGAGIACHTGSKTCFYRLVPMRTGIAEDALRMTKAT